MTNTIKRIIYTLFTLTVLIAMCIFAGCANEDSKLNRFYEAVTESQTKLDTVADDIYSCWYDAIYNEKYSGDINTAIATAQVINSENIDFIELNEATIQSLYKDLRDSKYSTEVKDVMSAYSNYYEFVINVSGSFNSYSSSKEPLKKDLANALKRLYFEL